MINLFIAIVRFFQARKKSDRLFFLLHLLILDVNATFCPLQGIAMPIWHVNACYILFYFLRKVKPLRRKWTKKGGKCRICDVFHIHCAKPAPQSLLSPLNFDKFRPFFVLPLSFFTKLLTVKGARPWKKPHKES